MRFSEIGDLAFCLAPTHNFNRLIMNTAEATIEKTGYRLDFVNPIRGEIISTMTFYADDRDKAVAMAYDHAGSHGWTDVVVR